MTTKYTKRVILIVPAESLEAASLAAAQIDPDTGGYDSFSVELSPTGEGEPTHYACEVAVTEEVHAQILELAAALKGQVYDAHQMSFNEALEIARLKRIEEKLDGQTTINTP